MLILGLASAAVDGVPAEAGERGVPSLEMAAWWLDGEAQALSLGRRLTWRMED
jgi:hypothetical protein